MLKSDAQRWGVVAKFFHWTTVVLILIQGTVGLIMVDLPKRPNVIPVYDFHKSLGMTIFALALLRLIWRAFDSRPRDPQTMPHWQGRVARAGHALLYVLIFAVPLSGYWFDSVSALRPLYFFGLFQVPHWFAANPDMKDIAAGTHEVLFWLLIAVAAGHALMALIHQYRNHDNLLRRMLPERRRTPA